MCPRGAISPVSATHLTRAPFTTLRGRTLSPRKRAGGEGFSGVETMDTDDHIGSECTLKAVVEQRVAAKH